MNETPKTEEKVVIYEPNQRAHSGWLGSFRLLILNTIAYRELIWQLFRRDFLMMHKRSFLGMGWLVLTPLVGILSWLIMNGSGILQPGDVGIPYPAYILISTSLWGLFMAFYSQTSASLRVAQGFILQVGFPHEVLIVKQLLQAAAGFGITLLINVIALLIFGVVPSWMVILTPLLMIPLFLLAGGVGLVTSIAMTVAPDIQRVVSFGMGLLMFVTPVIYASKVENSLLQKIIDINPLTYLVGGMRDIIIYGSTEHPDRYVLSVLFSLVVFAFCWRFFYMTEHKIVEKLI